MFVNALKYLKGIFFALLQKCGTKSITNTLILQGPQLVPKLTTVLTNLVLHVEACCVFGVRTPKTWEEPGE